MNNETQNIYIPYDKYFVTFTCDKAEDRPIIQKEADRYIDAVKDAEGGFKAFWPWLIVLVGVVISLVFFTLGFWFGKAC